MKLLKKWLLRLFVAGVTGALALWELAALYFDVYFFSDEITIYIKMYTIFVGLIILDLIYINFAKKKRWAVLIYIAMFIISILAFRWLPDVKDAAAYSSCLDHGKVWDADNKICQ